MGTIKRPRRPPTSEKAVRISAENHKFLKRYSKKNKIAISEFLNDILAQLREEWEQ